MYLTIAYALLAAITFIYAFRTKKAKRVANITMFVVAGTFALQRIISGDHSVIYPLATFKAMYLQILSLSQNQWLGILIGSAVLTGLTVIIAYVQIKIIRDRV